MPRMQRGAEGGSIKEPGRVWLLSEPESKQACWKVRVLIGLTSVLSWLNLEPMVKDVSLRQATMGATGSSLLRKRLTSSV